MVKQSEAVIALRLDAEIAGAGHALAAKYGRDLNEQIVWSFIEALDEEGLLPVKLRDWLLLREKLVQRFGMKAVVIDRAEGWQEKVIAETARRLMAEDAGWADDYRKLIGGDPYARGIKAKDRINPMLGRRVKLLLGAKTGTQFAVPQPSIFASSSRLQPPTQKAEAA